MDIAAQHAQLARIHDLSRKYTGQDEADLSARLAELKTLAAQLAHQFSFLDLEAPDALNPRDSEVRAEFRNIIREIRSLQSRIAAVLARIPPILRQWDENDRAAAWELWHDTLPNGDVVIRPELREYCGAGKGPAPTSLYSPRIKDVLDLEKSL